MEEINAPPLSALFLVTFDQKVGYTIVRQETSPGIDLAGVEFKCLPSGIHEVQNDIIYFSHGKYIGINAFLRSQTSSAQRNATFAGLGVLVDPEGGRLGSVWRHIESLRHLVREAVDESNSRNVLEDFWSRYRSLSKSKHAEEMAESLPLLHKEMALDSIEREGPIQSDHPASSLKEMLRTFGPLVFPLHRKALLRQRILLLGHAPVQQLCHFVYDIFLLTHFANEDAGMSSPAASIAGYELLFNVGIADIDQLADSPHYIACTTDSILADKPQLYDLIIRFPEAGSQAVWPTIMDAAGQQVKATERDVVRFNVMSSYLDLHSEPENDEHDAVDQADDGEESSPLVTTARNPEAQPASFSDLTETNTWTGMAYRTLSRLTSSEATDDRGLAAAFDDSLMVEIVSRHDSVPASTKDMLTILELFAYLNSQIINGLRELIRRGADGQQDVLDVLPSDVQDLGLDAYSKTDRAFVETAMLLYHGKECAVLDEGIQLCGLRIC